MKITINIPDKDNKEIREAVENIQTENEVQKLNAVCFWLIKMCTDTNAKSATIRQENVRHLGTGIGSWEIKLKTYVPKK